MENPIFGSVDVSTVNTPSPFDHLEYFKAEAVAADIAVKCVICEKYTPMNSHDYRAQGVFVCDKCKRAVLYIRELLENGGSVV